MTRENKILLWCLLGGVSLIAMPLGAYFVDSLPYRNRSSAGFAMLAIGVAFLLATFVLREVFKNHGK